MAKKFGVNRGWGGGGGGGKDGANGQTTKIFYILIWLESLSILLQIYTFACNFVLEKGGVLLLGSVLLLGHIR